jgi:hypothetical protein
VHGVQFESSTQALSRSGMGANERGELSANGGGM